MIDDVKFFLNRELKINIERKTKKREWVDGRALFYAILKQYTSFSLDKIGDAFDRDHATVIHALNNTYINSYKFGPGIKEAKDKFDYVYNIHLNNPERSLWDVMNDINEDSYETQRDTIIRLKAELAAALSL
jgi:hypothetical protein